MSQAEYAVVFVTAPSLEVARRVGFEVVEKKLAACANLVPGIESIFHWEGKMQQEQEVFMLLKTRAGLIDDLVAAIRDLHPYSTPEIIALPILSGSRDYLEWIGAETTAG